MARGRLSVFRVPVEPGETFRGLPVAPKVVEAACASKPSVPLAFDTPSHEGIEVEGAHAYDSPSKSIGLVKVR